MQAGGGDNNENLESQVPGTKDSDGMSLHLQDPEDPDKKDKVVPGAQSDNSSKYKKLIC